MESRNKNILFLVVLLFISFTLIFSPKKTENEIADSAAEIRVMKKKIKRAPASNPIIDNRPILGTNFKDNMSKRAAPPQSNNGGGQEVGFVDELMTDENDNREAPVESSAVAVSEDYNDVPYYNGGQEFIQQQAEQQIPLAPKESRAPANSYPGGMRFSSVPPPLIKAPAPAATTTAPDSGSSSSGVSPSITYVGIIEGQLVIRGTNLNSINDMSLSGPLVNTGLEAITRTSSEIVAMSLNGVTLLAGTLYDLVISDANGSSTFPIDIELADGSVAFTKLAPLAAGRDGYILVWNEGLARWEDEAPTWLPATGGIHYSAGDVGIGTSTPNSLLNIVENVPGSFVRMEVQNTDAASPDKRIGLVAYGSTSAKPNSTGLESHNADFFHLYHNGNERISIGPGGHVGIGQPIPVYQMDVRNQFGDSTVRAQGSLTANFNANGGGSKITQITSDNVQGKVGTTSDAGSMPFSIMTNGQDRIFVETGGQVGVATSNPGVAFQVGEAGDPTTAEANAWNTFSDERLKKNFKVIDKPLEKVRKISGYSYKWKDSNDKKTMMGVKAQEVQKVFPEVVSQREDGILSVSYGNLIAPIIEAVKELADRDDKRIKTLEAENARLRKQNEELDRRLAKLEKSR